MTPGTKLGPYEIQAPLGAGGMGEVYRARDTKLGRDVAIKILPDLFVNDPERVARFEREAQVLASLNHPHIAAIYGLDEAQGSRFLVLELVDGETLAQKLAHGSGLMAQEGSGLTAQGLSQPKPLALSPKPIPIGEAIDIARQIVDALEAAHDKGIVHRDLKPANIALTADGLVKVLDFGLAKAMEPDAGSNLSNSPTLTVRATQAGVIMGTAAYMSPEQAKGRAADKRSDVWAFGCVLYEMLTGKRAFEGEDVSDTLAAILRGEPDWNAIPPDVPANLRTILKRCLEKDRRTRIPDISVVRFMMDEAGTIMSAAEMAGLKTRPPEGAATEGAATEAAARRSAVVWKIATGLLALAAVAGSVIAYVAWPSTPPVVRFLVMPPDNTTFVIVTRAATSGIISPDGRTLAFTARDAAGKVLLWLRPIDALTAQPLAGTDGAAFPFWSPDSRFIAYFAGAKLLKIAAGGGPPQTLCAAATGVPGSQGGTWSRAGVIVFNGGSGQLLRVSSAGGQPTPLTRLAPGQTVHSFPSFLPDGRHVLFHARGQSQVAGIYIASLETGESKRLLAADSGGIYAAQGGYLVFRRQDTLLAQSFDPKTLVLAGEPFPIAERVTEGLNAGTVAFSVSDNGVLAYGTGAGRTAGLQMTWVDRQGKVIGTVGPQENYRGIDLEPDGKRVAAHRHESESEARGDIWLTDTTRATTSRFTFEASQENVSPIWSPDGSFIVFGSARNGKFGLYRKPSNLAGDEERLLESEHPILPMSWSPDGHSIVYHVLDPKTLADVWMLPLSGDRKPIPLLNTPFTESHGQISPDGKWLAYQSGETGRSEIYVRPFPAGPGKWQISTSGGIFPRWRGDGRELFYLERPNLGKLVAVEVRSAGSVFEAGTPKELFDSGYFNMPHPGGGGAYHTFAVSADGQRFLIPRTPNIGAETGPTPIVVVLNWTEAITK